MTWDINRDCDKRMHFSTGVVNLKKNTYYFKSIGGKVGIRIRS